MILKVIDLTLGSAGRFIRDFYFDNSLWINAIVLLYAILITWTHRNLRSLYFEIEKLILEIVPADEKDFKWKKIKAELLAAWMEKNGDRKLILPTMNDIWIEKIPAERIMDVFSVNEDFIKMVIVQHYSYPPKKAFSKDEFTAWKEYLHQMKKGMRPRPAATSTN